MVRPTVVSYQVTGNFKITCETISRLGKHLTIGKCDNVWTVNFS